MRQTDPNERAIPLEAMVTGEELVKIQVGAAAAGLSTGEWLREAALDPVSERWGDALVEVLIDLGMALPVMAELRRRAASARG